MRLDDHLPAGNDRIANEIGIHHKGIGKPGRRQVIYAAVDGAARIGKGNLIGGLGKEQDAIEIMYISAKYLPYPIRAVCVEIYLFNKIFLLYIKEL